MIEIVYLNIINITVISLAIELDPPIGEYLERKLKKKRNKRHKKPQKKNVDKKSKPRRNRKLIKKKEKRNKKQQKKNLNKTSKSKRTKHAPTGIY